MILQRAPWMLAAMVHASTQMRSRALRDRSRSPLCAATHGLALARHWNVLRKRLQRATRHIRVDAKI